MHGTSPKSNVEYWQQKINDNKTRDLRVVAQLAEGGWQCVRIWEHEEPKSAVDMIEKSLRAIPASRADQDT
jgi:DNA mismatch endonuclease (patch repair protein)